jgi:hypothetical protein
MIYCPFCLWQSKNSNLLNHRGNKLIKRSIVYSTVTLYVSNKTKKPDKNLTSLLFTPKSPMGDLKHNTFKPPWGACPAQAGVGGKTILIQIV